MAPEKENDDFLNTDEIVSAIEKWKPVIGKEVTNLRDLRNDRDPINCRDGDIPVGKKGAVDFIPAMVKIERRDNDFLKQAVQPIGTHGKLKIEKEYCDLNRTVEMKDGRLMVPDSYEPLTEKERTECIVETADTVSLDLVAKILPSFEKIIAQAFLNVGTGLSFGDIVRMIFRQKYGGDAVLKNIISSCKTLEKKGIAIQSERPLVRKEDVPVFNQDKRVGSNGSTVSVCNFIHNGFFYRDEENGDLIGKYNNELFSRGFSEPFIENIAWLNILRNAFGKNLGKEIKGCLERDPQESFGISIKQNHLDNVQAGVNIKNISSSALDVILNMHWTDCAGWKGERISYIPLKIQFPEANEAAAETSESFDGQQNPSEQ